LTTFTSAEEVFARIDKLFGVTRRYRIPKSELEHAAEHAHTYGNCEEYFPDIDSTISEHDSETYCENLAGVLEEMDES